MASAMKGRGALSNPPGRFDKLTKTFEHDGWTEEELPDRVDTIAMPEPARSIISRNQSPDIGFSQSINPYRGCEHACPYCARGDTLIAMADGSTKQLADIRVGDEIFGTRREGWYRRYVKTRVLAHWGVTKHAHCTTLRNGVQIVTGPDHRFLAKHTWKFVARGAPAGPRRLLLAAGDRLVGG